MYKYFLHSLIGTIFSIFVLFAPLHATIDTSDVTISINLASAAVSVCPPAGSGCVIVGNALTTDQLNTAVSENKIQQTSRSGRDTVYTATSESAFAEIAQQIQTGNAGSAATKANNSLGWFGNQVYGAIIQIFNALFAAIITVVGNILAFTGQWFDLAVDYTIISFADTYTRIFADGVNAAWSGFRDVANIVMIAMFVFVAVMVIVGSQTYGLSRFGVRILVIAVLINFSLFFTKVIIDISNITAIQFSKAIQINTPGSGSGDLKMSEVIMQKAGLAGSFYNDAFAALDRVSGSGKDNTLSLGNSFLYTILFVIFATSLTYVFLYGMILLITRSVGLIVLLLTSSLAFAAYIVPKYGDTWWGKWWDHLTKYAIFAPLFMLMMWATINILDKIAGTSNVGIIEAMVNKSQNSLGLDAIFNMLIVIGLVYASLKISDELSIAGAGFAKSVAGFGASTVLATSGVSTAARLGLRARNAAANRAGGALMHVPFMRELGAQIKGYAKTDHIGDTKLNKELSSKLGISLGSNQNEAINKYFAEKEKKAQEGAASAEQEKAVEALKGTRDALAAQQEAAKQPLKEQSATAEAKGDRASDNLSKTKQERNDLRLMEKQAQTKLSQAKRGGDEGEITEAEAKLDKAQAAISKADNRIERLSRDIQKAAKVRQSAERSIADIDKDYGSRIRNVDSDINNESSKQRKEDIQKDLASEAVDNRGALSYAGIDRAAVKKEIGAGQKSDFNRLVDAVKQQTKEQTTTMRREGDAEAARDKQQLNK